MIRFFEPLLQPIGLTWLFVFVGCIWAFARKQHRLGLFLLVPVLFLLAFGSTRLAEVLVAGLERPYLDASVKKAVPCDAVVMLGGTHRNSRHDLRGVDLHDSADRILVALELVRQGKGKALVLGGGGFREDGKLIPEARLLENWILEWHLSPVEVLDLGICEDTHGEAVRVRQLMSERGWKQVALVTSAFHMARAQAVFRKEKIRFIPVACDFKAAGINHESARVDFSIFPRLDRFEKLGWYMREKMGQTVYRWRGWID